MILRNGLWILFFSLFILLFSHSPSLADTTVPSRISADTTWTLAGSPYIATSTVQVYGTSTTPVTLTIEPGVVVKFASGAGLQIGNGTNQGALVARGNSTDRITFTRSGTSGTWGSITFNDGTVDGTTVLEKADIQYSSCVSMTSASPTLQDVAIACDGSYGINLSSSSPVITGGSLTNTSSTGQGIYGSGSPIISNYSISIVNTSLKYGVYLPSGSTSALSITNSTVANGLYIGSTSITPTITGNTFTNVDSSPIHAGANIIGSILNNNTVTGMTSAGKIEVIGEQVKQDALWKRWPAPYVVTTGGISVYKDTTSPATLTIEPGVTVKFNANYNLQIGNGASQGAIVARGTANDRIVFTRSGTSGTWPGIDFQNGTIDNTTVFEYVDIQYNSSINISSASPTFRNSTITGSSGPLYLTWSNPVLDNVIFDTNYNGYALRLSYASPAITGGSLTNTNSTGQGIYLYASSSPSISNYTVSIVNTANKYGFYSEGTGSFSLTNSSIANGIYLSGSGYSSTITGNTFTNADSAPIRAGANIIGQILNNNTIAGMTSAGRIEIVGEPVNQNTVWRKWPAPYHVVSGTLYLYKDSTNAATLTIDPGVTMKFASNSGLQIGDSSRLGSLVAQGTAADRIVFTRLGTSGTWAGLTFNDKTVDATAILEYVDVQYSTGVTMTSASPVFRNSTITDVTGYLNLSSSNPTLENVIIANNGAYGIYLWSSNPVITNGSLTNTNASGQGIVGYGSPVIANYTVSIPNTPGKYGIYLNSPTTALSITNSTIGNSLYIGSTGINPTITGNTFTNADNSPIHAGANIIAQILDNNTINGMTSAGKIEVICDQVTRNATWKRWAAPYVVVLVTGTSSGIVSVYKDTTTASTLIIEPGTVVKFSANTSLQVGSGTNRGVLVAKGTSGDKIIFTSSQASPAPGNWNGINLSGDASSASVLEQAVIEYAGTGLNFNNANLTISSSAPVIRNCTIRNSGGSGVYVTSATNWPVIMDSEITGNKWGVYSTGSNPYITNSRIIGNTTYGVYNATTTVEVDARDNWWGAASGPTHSSNPSGTGDKVSDKVLYNPWLGQAPGTTFAITEAKALPTSLNPEGDYITFAAKISALANWTITITDSNNAAVRTFTGTGTTINQKWYGENDQAAKVADGPYYYKIEAINPATSETASAPQGMLVVSRNIPIAIIDAPLDNQQFTGGTTIDITGTASDSTDFKNYKLDYGVGENPSTWTNVKTATTPITNGLISALNTTTLTNSVYTLRLTVTDNAGNIAIETARVRLSWIQNVAATEGYISPNGDGVKESTQITSTFNQQASWTLTFKTSAGSAVRTYSGTGSSMAQTWDGKDEAGQVVPDGSYTYRIDAMGGFVTGSLVVDTALPTAVVTSPAANTVLQNVVDVIGTASDTNFDTYKLEYGPAGGAGPWTSITTATSAVSSGTLATWTTNDQTNAVLLQNGGYTLRLTAADKAGNSNTTTLPVNVDNLVLSSVSINSHSLDTLAAQTNTISYSINGAGNVTLKIVPEKQGPSGLPIYQTSQVIAAAGSSFFTWAGKDNSGKVVADEAYLYILEASDGTRTDSYSPPAPTGTGSVSCTQDSYNPYKNDPKTINYTVGQPSRINISISWGAQNFKIIDAAARVGGSYTFDWDGRNSNGKILPDNAVAACSVASLLRENFIITSGDTVNITDLKTDPYELQFSYGEFTKIKYIIDHDAAVTVTATSLGGATVTIMSNQLQTAGPHEIEWKGLTSSDSTGKQFAVSEEGDYVVVVQAANPSTGTVSTRRGFLKVAY